MAKRNGGIIGPSNVPTGQYGGTASGVWRLRDAFNYLKAGLWPGFATYPVGNSLRFNSGSSDYLDRTPSTTTDRQKATLSFWTKYSDDTSGNVGRLFNFGLYPNGTLIYFGDGVYKGKLLIDNYAATVATIGLVTTQLFRDYSAWYHIVVAFDTTQATASNRVKLYVNGTQVTTFDAAVYPSQNENLFFNFSSSTYQIGKNHQPAYFSGYLAETNMIDGQQLTPSSFGQTDSATGIWTPLPFTGTFGTNGFFLKFQDSSALGDDTSGNGNDFTVNNLTSVDQSTDTPTNNFATFNPLFTPSPSNVSTFTEGNLKIATNSTSQNSDGYSTIGLTSGKWYGEFKLIAEASGESNCGVKNNIENPTTNGLHGVGGFCVSSNGNSFDNGSSQGAGNFSDTYTTTDIISIALDLDNNKVYFAKNGSWTNGTGSWNQANPTGFFTLTASQTYFMGVGDKSTSQSSTWEANFGNPPFTISSGNADAEGFGNFEYAVPSGYFALCTKNLAEYA